MISHFEHFATFCKNNNLQITLERWEKAGFSIHNTKGENLGGRKNGFIKLIGGYFEICSISNEKEFSKACSPMEIELRKNPYLHLFVMSSLAPEKIWDSIKGKFPEMAKSKKSFWGKSSSGMEYCSVPTHGTPGAFVSGISYPNDKNTEFLKQFFVSKNGIFGICGMILVSSDSDKERQTWFNTLEPIWRNSKLGNESIENGLQSIEWISPNEYESFFGKWSPISNEYNRLGVIKLGSEDLDLTKKMLLDANFEVYNYNDKLYVRRDENTGISFIIQKGSAIKFYDHLQKLSTN